MSRARTLVTLATYNEIDNLPDLVDEVFRHAPDVEVLVIDDNSPDRTAEEVAQVAAGEPRVKLLRRPGKQGLASAYVTGFRKGVEEGYDVVVEMDADGSHAPEDLPRLLHALAGASPGTGADVVLGSRYVPGGQVVNWSQYRQWLSRGGNYYSRVALGMRIHDLTGGFRTYRRQVLECLDLSTVASQGYCFQVDLAWRAVRAGFAVLEVPITFTEREHGQSKMNGTIVREALWRVTVWGVQRRLERLRRRPDLADSPSRANQS